jgi:C4-dicarboxylate-binding protein DctP
MRLKRKNMGLCLLFGLLLLLLASCGSPSSSSESQESTEGSGETTASEGTSDEVYTITYAHDHTTTSPFQISAERFKEVLEERSNGRFKVEIYPAQQLGSSREMIESLQMGTIQMVNLPVSGFSGFDKRMMLVDMPFLFPNEDIFIEVMEGEIGRELLDNLDEQGFKGFSFIVEGFKQFTNNYPIHTPEDFEGKRIRTMNSPVIMDTYKAWGANPVPIDFSEVYNSLQQGVVDGQENPFLSIHDMKFYEVQDYMILSDHSYLSYVQVFNLEWFESLPEDLQKLLWEVATEVNEEHKQLMAEQNEIYLENIKASGIEIIELTEEEKELFRKASQPVYDQYREVFGDLLDRTIEQVEKLQVE